MISPERDRLARLLAYYDQAMAEAIQIAANPEDERYESAQVFIPVLEDWMEDAEARLNQCEN